MNEVAKIKWKTLKFFGEKFSSLLNLQMRIEKSNGKIEMQNPSRRRERGGISSFNFFQTIAHHLSRLSPATYPFNSGKFSKKFSRPNQTKTDSDTDTEWQRHMDPKLKCKSKPNSYWFYNSILAGLKFHCQWIQRSVEKKE